ncbi:hypothetical protein ACN20G_31710 (plasmid) [Streptomyces sp. BI20]|uniref:hypothetical protein n=1 Tax=Streptomyces sp. BI20 TaxID=3403460 RepID=UPI003C72D77D
MERESSDAGCDDGITGFLADLGALARFEKRCGESSGPIDSMVSSVQDFMWDSTLAPFIDAGVELAQGLIVRALALALTLPTVNLGQNGLFGKGTVLPGMMAGVGCCVAVFCLLWQAGRAALSGRVGFLGIAFRGFAINAVLCAGGLGLISGLLRLGDAMALGLVRSTLGDPDGAFRRITGVLVVSPELNPVGVAAALVVVLIVSFGLMLTVFLREALVPLQCLLLPIASAGQIGGAVTRAWLPRLVTSVMVVVVYKPMVALIVCAGFTQVGHSGVLLEWVRGVATIVLALFAPVALSGLFSPVGHRVGNALADGGARAVLAAGGARLAERVSEVRAGIGGALSGGGGDGGGGTGSGRGSGAGGHGHTALDQARRLEHGMPSAGLVAGVGVGPSLLGADSAARLPGQAARGRTALGVPAPAVSLSTGGPVDSSDEGGLLSGQSTVAVGSGAAGSAYGRHGFAAGVGTGGALGLTVLDGLGPLDTGPGGEPDRAEAPFTTGDRDS